MPSGVTICIKRLESLEDVADLLEIEPKILQYHLYKVPSAKEVRLVSNLQAKRRHPDHSSTDLYT